MEENQNEMSMPTEEVVDKNLASTPGVADASTVENKSTMVAKMIGKKLYIDGYIYVRQLQDAARVYWKCKRRVNPGECPGRASTSNPSLSEKIVVYKGLDQSKHDHPPCPMEVEEAEEEAKFGKKRGKRNSMGSLGVSNEMNPTAERISKSPDVSSDEIDVVSVSENRSSNQSRKRKRAKSLAPQVSQAATTAKLIGKRLYIDGYIYQARTYKTEKIQWTCSRSSTEKCSAKALTSNPSTGEELLVHQSIDVSAHNHSSSLSDVTHAEELANYGYKRSRLSLPNIQTHNESIGAEIQPSSGQNSDRETVENINGADKSAKKRTKVVKKKGKMSSSKKLYKTKRYSLVNDSGIYRKFLLKFLENPIFEKQIVMDALKDIYKSQKGCLISYVTLLENREKVDHDLETLRNDPTATISAINCGKTSTVQNDITNQADGQETSSVHDHVTNQVENTEMPVAQNYVTGQVDSTEATTVQNNMTNHVDDAEMTQILVSNVRSLQNDMEIEHCQASCQAQGTQIPRKEQRAEGVRQTSIAEAAQRLVGQNEISGPMVNSVKPANFNEPRVKREVVCVDIADANKVAESQRFPSYLDQSEISRENLPMENMSSPVLVRNGQNILRCYEGTQVARPPTMITASSMQDMSILTPPIPTIDLIDEGARVNKEIPVVDLIHDNPGAGRAHMSSVTRNLLQDKENQPNNFGGNPFNIQTMFEPRIPLMITDSNTPTLISSIQIPLVHDISAISGLHGGGNFSREQFYTEIRVYRRNRQPIESQLYSSPFAPARPFDGRRN